MSTIKEARQYFPVSRTVFNFLLLLGTLSQVQADKVDTFIKAEMAKNRIPGLALAVIKEGRIVKAKGYGLANVELNVPATADTVFPIASITKPFTALAIMTLVEDGKVGLDEKIGKYLTNAPNTWSNITVRHLLTHTAGVVGGVGGPQTNANQGRWRVKTAPRYEALRARPLSFQPGDRWQYSGTGYFLLGMIIESVSGQSYREFLPARIFRPAGITSTFILDVQEIVKNRTASYSFRDGRLTDDGRGAQVELPADGGIISSVNDLAKWEMALYSEKLVKRLTLEQMWTPGRLNDGSRIEGANGYGLGWGLHDHRGQRTIGHAGSSGAEFVSFPEKKLTVVMLCNLGFSDWVDQNDIARTVAGMYDPTLRPPQMLSVQPDRDPETTQRLLGFLSDFASGQDSALMTPGLRGSLNKFKANFAEYFSTYVVAPLSEQLKDRRSFTFISCDKVEGRGLEHLGTSVNQICYYKIVSPKKTVHYTFWLTADGRIADFEPKE